ncbi:hypothetical protein HNQ92_003026 [Rhabdobacter roseus]|uniref:Outer membrane protein beta-barrel domain-containing protein n=1 Tax=Rhabdobacter roseus TaxID=1655419 RepID=A0A840TXF2_9BACT|nr:porin family protein [Rhabdobacter roseus]MBB5284878.1 hypothetical protein [Rhabdobacter roseus]
MAICMFWFVSTLVCQAQRDPDKFTLGAHAGWDLSDITKAKYTYRGGFVGGVSATFGLGKNFYLQPEVNFQQQGANYTYELRIGNNEFRQGKASLRLNYLNVPVLLKYRLGSTNLRVFAGPQMGFKLNAVYVAKEFDIYNDIDRFKTIDFSGVGGLEYLFPLSGESKSLVVSARHFSGFTDFTRYFYSVPAEGEGYRYRGFSFLLGVRF